ncbi:MAG: hypothetical protein Q9214_006570, partial [Letrouitia sp. 1 TL-2023]
SPEDRFDLYPDFPAFKASAQDGCKLCELLREALLERYSDEGIQRGEDDYDDTIKEDWLKEPWDKKVRLTLAKIDTRDPAALHGKISLRLPNVEALSPVNMRLIFGWMDTCEREHEKCRSEKVPRLPKRVIDVGSAEGEDSLPRLLETNRAPAQYVALSHCWGSWQGRSRYKHARLLEANYRDFLDAIRLQDVPPTFKDAIIAVRSLRLRYLWIDALCIIQDSKSDWAEQSGQMYDIYESSYLTIVATKAQSSGDGFLSRPHKPVVTVPYNDENDPTVEGQFYLSRFGEPRSSWNSVDAVSWNTRGWTFQERLLSKRLLHFSANGLYWECRTTDRSELNHSGRDSYNRTKWLLGDNFEDLLPSTESTSFDRRYERWYMVVAKYETLLASDSPWQRV